MTRNSIHVALIVVMVVSMFFDATMFTTLLAGAAYFTSAHFAALIKDI